MLLLIHITVALLGILEASLAIIRPSQRKLNLTYGLLAATLATGTYLVWQLQSPLVSACLSGLAYMGFVLTATTIARYRLVRINLHTNSRSFPSE